MTPFGEKRKKEIGHNKKAKYLQVVGEVEPGISRAETLRRGGENGEF